MQASLPLTSIGPWRERWFPNGEWVLLVALALEVAIFAAHRARTSSRVANFFEVVRLSVELGLLALALTPIMITGGIDLSVGSMMGLAAVVLRRGLARWRTARSAAAARSRCVLGCAGGALNALLITRLEHPAADRDARVVLDVPRHRRRASRTAR